MHVPFPGTGAALPAVIGNQVGAMWGFTAGLIPFIRDGKLRALAVSSKERSPALPDVPTVAEAGVPGYEATSWIGMLAPAATPPAIIDRLWDAVNEAMKVAVGARHVDQRRHRHRREQAGRIPRGDRERSREIRQARGRVQVDQIVGTIA